MTTSFLSCLRRRPKVIVLSAETGLGRRLTAEEQARRLDERRRVLGSVTNDNPLLRAILDLIEEEIRVCNGAAQEAVANHGICASENGGAQHLERLRERIFEERLRTNG